MEDKLYEIYGNDSILILRKIWKAPLEIKIGFEDI